MVKTKGVTLVALATLLAGFVASCTSDETPSFADIPSEATTVEIAAEDDPPGLTSSLSSKDQATPTVKPTVEPAPTAESTPTPVPTLVVNADPTLEPTSVPEVTAELAPLDRPYISTPSGLYINEAVVVVDNNEPGSTLVYTLDGSEPTRANGSEYTKPFTIGTTAPMTLKVRAIRDGMADSEVVEAGFRVLPSFEESSEPIYLSGDEVLEITDTHYLHRGDITLSGNAKLIITDSVFEHVKDFAFEHEVKVTENAEIIVNNSGIGTTCNGSFNWSFFDNAKLTVNRMDPRHAKCNTWNFMSGSSEIDVADWRTFSGTVCDQTSVAIKDSTDMEIELCMPWPTIMDAELPSEVTDYVFDPGENSTIEYQLTMANSTIDGWGINVGPGSDITIRNTPSITVGVGIGYPAQDEAMTAEGIKPGHWEDQSWDFGADAKLRLVNTFTYGWELNAWGGNTMIVRDSDYSGSAVNGSDSHYVIENSTSGQLVAFEQVDMIVTNSVITGDVVANDDTVITLIDCVVGIAPSTLEDSPTGGNAYARGNGRVVLRNTTVYGEQITQDNGEIVVE